MSDCFVAPHLQTKGMLVRRYSHSSQIQASSVSIIYAKLSTIYLATGLKKGKPEPDEDEFLKIKKISFSHACKLIKKGQIKDAKTIIAILIAKKGGQSHFFNKTYNLFPGKYDGLNNRNNVIKK